MAAKFGAPEQNIRVLPAHHNYKGIQMRKKFIAGNWKMNLTPSASAKLAEEIREAASGQHHADVVVCPPFTSLDRVSRIVTGSNIRLGAQDMHWEDQGAFTGKISWDMLKDIGVEFVILGHSEQRTYFNETNQTVNKKSRKALDTGLIPIVCVGETLDEREKNRTNDVVRAHVLGAFEGISRDQARSCVIAYEPVWAIGTGRNATPEQAQDVHAFIRGLLKEMYDGMLATEIRILYGGSMKADNAAGLLAKPDIDGGLIGGASLKSDSFTGIIAAAK
jgi:triosephosphate isomerase